MSAAIFTAERQYAMRIRQETERAQRAVVFKRVGCQKRVGESENRGKGGVRLSRIWKNVRLMLTLGQRIV